MMRYALFLFLSIALGSPLLAGEALGIKYDKVLIFRLKQPEVMKKKSPKLLPTEKFSKFVISAHQLKERFHGRVDKLFSIELNFNNDSADSKLQLFSLAFYKEDKCVFIVSPNLTGGDIYASNKKGLTMRSLSKKQRDQFLEIVYLSMMFGDDPVDLNKMKDNK